MLRVDTTSLPSPIAALLFDFDGVIVASEHIRIDGFRAIFANEPPELVERLIDYHVLNGGISRYAKIRWFYETLKGEPCADETVSSLADQFKGIMLERMMDPGLIVPAALDFIRAFCGRIPMHICSGSDGEELRAICRALGIEDYFLSIHGSPTPKKDLIIRLMAERGYDPAGTVFIGDAINDFDAAKASGLVFCGINNESLRAVSDYYIDNFPIFNSMVEANCRNGRDCK